MALDDPPAQPPRGGDAMSCTACGGPLAHDQRYCLHCGAATRDVVLDLLGPPRPAAVPHRPQPTGRLAALRRPLPTARLAALRRRLPTARPAAPRRALPTARLAALRRRLPTARPAAPRRALPTARPAAPRRALPTARLAALRRRLPTRRLAALRRLVPARVLRAAAAARTSRWLRPGPARAAVPALACAVGVGVLAGALAGPPPAATARRIVAMSPPAAPAAAASLPAGDLGALQAPAPPPPPPPVSDSSSSTATDSPASSQPAASTHAASSGDGDDAPATAKKPKAAKPAKPSAAATKQEPPPVKHVVVVMLADKGFAEAFGPASGAPYLARELRSKGALLRRFFATAHGSLPNYIALLGGQAANPDSTTGCAALTPFAPAGKPAASGEVRGKGCVFGAGVQSLPGQLERKKLAWRAYVDGAGPAAATPAAPAATPATPAGPCQPPPAAPDGTPPAVDRNPFLFFAAIASEPGCTAKVTGLATLAADLAGPLAAAPAFTLIVPDACSAGRDAACPAGEPAGLPRSDAWLREWIPRLMASPAYADDGLIVITFDQARVTGREADSTSCCGQPLGVNQPESVDPQAPAPGGGRVGALVLSPHVKPGIVSDVPYNHFALLRTIEDAFDLAHLGLASDDALKPLGADVFGTR